jgi:hypothetical protein
VSTIEHNSWHSRVRLGGYMDGTGTSRCMLSWYNRTTIQGTKKSALSPTISPPISYNERSSSPIDRLHHLGLIQ